jgi:hypothetical protein
LVLLDSATDWLSAAAALIQAFAILLGGAWAYYKFVRGRTFASRAEVRVRGKLLTFGRERGISVAATLHNPGETRLPIRAPSVTAQAVLEEGWRAPPNWTRVGIAPIFADHHWIEAKETITDETVIPLPTRDGTHAEFLAYRVECVVFEDRRAVAGDWGQGDEGGLRWSSAAIVSGTLRSVEDAQQGAPKEGDVP